ncbi:MAG: hypothetical protein K2Y37_00375 [Pirellulales bacterium]|nr:hypothetical protein [Pirellulales bacterium]
MVRTIAVALVGGALVAASASAEERYYEENGVTYRETRERFQRPLTEVVHQPTTRTVYREQYRTEFADTVHVSSKPVTEWRLESYWRGRWNPFVEPYLAQRWVKRTRYETQTQTTQQPILRRELVAENRTEHTPVVTQRMVEEEVVRRVAVARAPTTNVASGAPPRTSDPFGGDAVARRVTIGGVSRLDGVPPRSIDTSGWHAGRTTVTR